MRDPMKILLIAPDLAHNGAARQVGQLARSLPPSRCNLTVAVLGAETPTADELRRAGVTVQALNWVRWFDPGALWRLRALVRDLAPDVVHVCGQRHCGRWRWRWAGRRRG